MVYVNTGRKSTTKQEKQTTAANMNFEVKPLSRVRLFATPWTIAYQAPPSVGFSRQEYWSGLPFPSPGALPNPGTQVSRIAGRPSEPPGKLQHEL